MLLSLNSGAPVLALMTLRNALNRRKAIPSATTTRNIPPVAAGCCCALALDISILRFHAAVTSPPWWFRAQILVLQFSTQAVFPVRVPSTHERSLLRELHNAPRNALCSC